MITLALIVAVVGLVLYLAIENKVAEVGRIMFFTGLLSILLGIGSKVVGR